MKEGNPGAKSGHAQVGAVTLPMRAQSHSTTQNRAGDSGMSC